MIYKGKEYDDNQILEILNNRDNDILTYKEKNKKFTNKLKTRKQQIKNYKKL